MKGVFKLLLILAVLCISYRCYEIGVVLRDMHQVRTISGTFIPNEGVHLPTKCAPYYHLSTDEWIECLLVGRK